MEKNFAEILKNLMREKGFNQVQLAKLVGCRQSQVHNWLAGKSAPNYLHIKRLARVMDVSYDKFFED